MKPERIYRLPLILEPQPEGGYTITCPVVPELVTEVDTLDQVQAHVADALVAVLELYEDLGKPLPPALRPQPTLPEHYPPCSKLIGAS